MPGAAEAAIRDAERLVGFRLPEDFRAFARDQDGLEGWFGEMYLMLYSVDTIVEVHRIHDDAKFMPGFVAFGSDGGAEMFGFDLRTEPAQVVMVGNVSGGWPDAIVQASSFTEFMQKRSRGEAFDFGLSAG